MAWGQSLMGYGKRQQDEAPRVNPWDKTGVSNLISLLEVLLVFVHIPTGVVYLKNLRFLPLSQGEQRRKLLPLCFIAIRCFQNPLPQDRLRV